MSLRTVGCLAAWLVASWAAAQDVDSGPAKGQPIPELKVYAVAGPIQGETVDYAAQRKDLPTIYLLIPADKFSRPMHGFVQALDKALTKEVKDGLLVAVWLTDDGQKTKDYLPKIAQYYPGAALTYFPGAKTGPKDWFINEQADITVILAHQGKVVGRLGYNSINDTVAPEVMTAFTKALKGKC
jgi:hypothetical protein